jgi:hypothetical protein
MPAYSRLILQGTWPYFKENRNHFEKIISYIMDLFKVYLQIVFTCLAPTVNLM